MNEDERRRVDEALLCANADRIPIQGFEYEMLQGCGDLITGRQIEFVFISTHNLKAHFQYPKYLAGAGYTIVAEHTPKESNCDEGLIVGAASPGAAPMVQISERPISMRLQLQTAAFRLLS